MVSTKQMVMNLVTLSLVLLSAFTNPVVSYPVPEKGPGHLFYIQRSLNRNTVVYEANFDEQGNLDAANPVKIYWVMYEKEGNIEELTYLERKFAYGINFHPVENQPNVFDIRMVSYDTLRLCLKQTAPYNAIITFSDDSKEQQLDHIYIHGNNAGLFSKVDYLEVYTNQGENSDLTRKTITIE
ncbi:DUF4833 domain-containing protein [Marinilabiliaceae bacterium JC017]|nr:DUF4833 domain-containing protein [Marinilabiliaceae bacterium JC017]